MSSAFKPGDCVQLKSGGPKMTVSRVTESTGRVNCEWFDGAKRQGAFFGPDSLKPYEPPAKPGRQLDFS